jgi:PIN domain nuclease of toxin-antitoxin system
MVVPLGYDRDLRLSKKAREVVSEQECFLSLASAWEMAIKVSLGKLKLPIRLVDYIPEQRATNGFSQLEIGFRHAVRCASLDWHRRDPFDRLLIAQALEDDLAIVSRDILLDDKSLPSGPSCIGQVGQVGQESELQTFPLFATLEFLSPWEVPGEVRSGPLGPIKI